MCKIIVGIQKEKNIEFRDIVMAQYDELEKERDGIGVLAIMRDGGMRIIRQENGYDEVYKKINKLLDDVFFLSIHTRTATSGSHDLTNVHFFEEKGIYLAHNGFVHGVFDKPFEHRKKGRKKTTIIVPREGGGLSGAARAVEGGLMGEQDEKIWKEIERLEKIMSECADCDYKTFVGCKKHKSVENRLDKLQTALYDGVPEKVQHYTWDGQPSDDGFYLKNENGIMVYDPAAKKGKMGFSWKGGTGLSDSYKFLKILVSKGKISEKSILESSAENDFMGFAVIYDSRTGKLWLLVNKDVRSVSDMKDYHLLFSYDPELSIKRYKYNDILGIEVYEETENNLENLPERYAARGVHEIQLIDVPKTKVEKMKTVNAS